MKSYLLKQLDALKSIKSKSGMMVITAVLLFLLLNAFKLALFNYYIIPNQYLGAFKYKLITSILVVLLIYPIALSIKPRIVFAMFYILQVVYILANLAYFFYYHSYLNILQWFALFNEGFLAAKNFSVPLTPKMLITFIDLPLFLYIVINYIKVHELHKKLHLFRIFTIVGCIACLLYIQRWNYNRGNFITTLMKDKYKGESPIVQWYGTVVNNVTSLVLMGNENQIINSLAYGKELTNNSTSTNRSNFIIIQVESLDSNIINKKYKDSYIAPYLHALSEQNIYYPYVLSYHEGGSTSDSEFSIINSIEPLDGFPAIKLSNYNYPNSMLNKLLNDSYTNLAFHGNSGVFFNRDSAFPKMGFNEFYDMLKMNLKHVGWGSPDHDVFNFALNSMKDLKEPYLSYIITMTSHRPFTNAQNYYINDQYNDIKSESVKNYFNSISYVDKAIKDFLTDMKAYNKNTYIFIIGDHTPEIDTDLFRQSSFIEGDKFFEFVPLIIITPDNKQYKEQKKVASFLDISPTILYNSGITFTLKSNGLDLINSRGSSNTIPFKHSEYDREDLYKSISKQSGK